MNHMKTRYYIANWKSYQSLQSMKKFLSICQRDQKEHKFSQIEFIGIAPSYEHLYFSHDKFNKLGIHVGAQDCSAFMPGAYTSQVSIQSLQDMQLSFSIIGHSEVRYYY